MANHHHHDDDASSSSSYFTYDVFLSFRGNTRLAFTDCLYHALTNKRIKVFRDDPDLRAGDGIRSTLFKAIERSRMFIVVLCQEYASSSWCLDEIVKIIECSHNEGKRKVLPVFYKVDPKDVRRQKNQYETAMNKHESRYGKDSERMKAWRSALFSVCELSGHHCTMNTHEGEIIDKIVGDALETLPLEPLYINHPLGFDSQLKDVKSLLEIESYNTRCMLTIYGDGVVDKTTFAGELYNEIRHQFEAVSFLANVSEKSNESINGLENLQKTLLSEMGEEAKTKIGSTFKGSSEIKRKLGHKRVLLVLDDVDSIQQLDSLVGGGDWFGPGSRIIITTRCEDALDEHVLDSVEIKKYCLDEDEFEGMAATRSNRLQKRYVEEDDVVSFATNFNVVIKKLKEEDSRSNVVSIIGMGGLGKTTLARKIYNNIEVKKLFPCRAWSYVSKDYNKKEVLLNLLCCFMSSISKFKDSNEEDLEINVRKCLKRKKYLVVLDDIWEPEVWDNVRGIFPNDINGCKILITSRNNEVANYTSPRPPHYLPFLDKEKSWELFCKKVFWGGKCPSKLESIGRSIVESCGGLPIAIITLAGILAKKRRSEYEWLRIKGHVRWHLAQDKTRVMDVLKLSYDLLPKRLKPCFLYFGIYPEDYKMPVKELIQLWIAEGFIQPQENGMPNAPEPEDVGEEYLDELVDRCLIRVASTRSCGGVKTCRIHDFLRDLCISESKVDNFLKVCTESNIHTLSNPHRLSFLCSPQSYISSIKCDQSDTRSLFFFGGNDYPDHTLKYFQSTRVLHLGRYKNFHSVPANFKTMIHLKYLKITNSNCLQDVPDCIWSLPNLETLDFWGWYTGSISDKIWKLKRLRHVYVRWEARLPANKPQADSRAMWNLQTLYEVALDPPTALLLNKGSFPNLRKLGLWYDPRDEKKGSLQELLRRLWYDPREDKCSLQELLRSLNHLSKLRKLKIRCCGSHLSLDHVFPSNLTKITLMLFRDLDSKSMNTLGQLPNLQSLTLLEGTVHCVVGEFPQLLVLKMESVEVQRWRLERGEMPRLRRLVVKKCSKWSELPQQLLSLTTLRKVRVVDPSCQLKNNLQNVKLNDGCKLIIRGGDMLGQARPDP